MSSIELCSGNLMDYDPVQIEGKMVFRAAEAFLTSVRNSRTLGRACSEIFALPRISADEQRADWYVPFDSSKADGSYEIIPFNELSTLKKKQVKAKIDAVLDKMWTEGQLGAGSSGIYAHFLSGDNGDIETSAMTYPDESCIYLVDNRPVITFWGFKSRTDRLNTASVTISRGSEQKGEEIKISGAETKAGAASAFAKDANTESLDGQSKSSFTGGKDKSDVHIQNDPWVYDEKVAKEHQKKEETLVQESNSSVASESTKTSKEEFSAGTSSLQSVAGSAVSGGAGYAGAGAGSGAGGSEGGGSFFKNLLKIAGSIGLLILLALLAFMLLRNCSFNGGSTAAPAQAHAPAAEEQKSDDEAITDENSDPLNEDVSEAEDDNEKSTDESLLNGDSVSSENTVAKSMNRSAPVKAANPEPCIVKRDSTESIIYDCLKTNPKDSTMMKLADDAFVLEKCRIGKRVYVAYGLKKADFAKKFASMYDPGSGNDIKCVEKDKTEAIRFYSKVKEISGKTDPEVDKALDRLR